ncbi:uncharacterized protein LOC120352676 [Nilaparvata lugens]|uniref:uncharacterized protein LOC120352676 n=1 Tax=Nilaparvata lugens TaxID=108931 RepID=UPI00193D9129|nr:uncharacterized protein LOC120352676 [Nilaparvata lugens]
MNYITSIKVGLPTSSSRYVINHNYSSRYYHTYSSNTYIITIPTSSGYVINNFFPACCPFCNIFSFSSTVTRGIIRGVENLDDLKVSEITVKVTKHLRESTPDELSSLAEDLASNEIDRTQSTTDGDKHKDRTQSTSDTDKHNVTVRLQVPQHCGARHGAGEFVFMARRKLGDLVLRCAPRLEDWIDVVRSENAKGSAHCLLYS